MSHKESKVVLRTHNHVYEFATIGHLGEGLKSLASIENYADVIYDKQKQKFIKCRRMNLTELNEMLELTRG